MFSKLFRIGFSYSLHCVFSSYPFLTSTGSFQTHLFRSDVSWDFECSFMISHSNPYVKTISLHAALSLIFHNLSLSLVFLPSILGIACCSSALNASVLFYKHEIQATWEIPPKSLVNLSLLFVSVVIISQVSHFTRIKHRDLFYSQNMWAARVWGEWSFYIYCQEAENG